MIKDINGFFPGELYPDTIVAGAIDIFENAWPNPQETIDAVENSILNPTSAMHWTPAPTIGHGVDQGFRTNYVNSISYSARMGNEVAQNIHNQMYMLLLASTVPYSIKHDIKNLYPEDYQMLRYSKGEKYDEHSDGDSSTARRVSAIVYLNNDYEGGELEFVNFGVKIKPEPGMLILFPSDYAYSHIAHPVISGTKYAIVTWLKDIIL